LVTRYVKIPRPLMKIMLSELTKVLKSTTIHDMDTWWTIKRVHYELEERYKDD